MELVIGLWASVFVLFLLLIFTLSTTEDGSFFIGMLLIVCFIAAGGINAKWLSSKNTAKVINETYKTNYSREDIFWSYALIEKQLMAKNEIVSDTKNSNVNLNIKSDKDGAVIIAPNR